ncbi:ADSL [Cordylochernes scorpioides]|uniref:ADSL n=1 Tax=Cordylochernes scorpioides TaxID=51811 RepID=A0ABY6K5Z2_9ARAC|nr:ADSL [Cordylochernes scorpioides]
MEEELLPQAPVDPSRDVEGKFLHYQSPLSSGYSSREMSYNFSDHNRFITWRKLWVYLAKAQRQMGLPIRSVQIHDMERNVENLLNDSLKELGPLRFDVNAHAHAFGAVCPRAAPIINLGAAPNFITENTDIMLMKEAFNIIIPKLGRCLAQMTSFADSYKDFPTLGFLHFKPSQLTTVGKRAACWMYDLYTSLKVLDETASEIDFFGIKDISGSQDNTLTLFNGNKEKVQKLEMLVTKMAGFDRCYLVCGQSYPRIVDYDCISALARLGSVISKITLDIRLLSHLQELEEMPDKTNTMLPRAILYKHNPIYSERCASLSRYLINLVSNPLDVASNQWLERTYDDSANRSITIPEAFLAADTLLNTFQNILDCLVVNLKLIDKHVNAELPLLVSDHILAAMVQQGSDARDCYQHLREVIQQAVAEIAMEGGQNSMEERIMKNPYFAPISEQLPSILLANNYIGLAADQVTEFLDSVRHELSVYATGELS